MSTQETLRPTKKSKLKLKPNLPPQLDPVSSRTKRALGLPGRSTRIPPPENECSSAMSSTGLLRVLFDLQAYSRTHFSFSRRRNSRRQKKLQSKHDQNQDASHSDIVLLDNRILSSVLPFTDSTNSYHPPRTIAYDPDSLRAFHAIKWEQPHTRKVLAPWKTVKYEAGDECWELSAIPWLAAVAHLNSNPKTNVNPNRLIIHEDELVGGRGCAVKCDGEFTFKVLSVSPFQLSSLCSHLELRFCGVSIPNSNPITLPLCVMIDWYPMHLSHAAHSVHPAPTCPTVRPYMSIPSPFLLDRFNLTSPPCAYIA